MKKYLIITHAYMAKGISSAIHMILGESFEIDYISGYVDSTKSLKDEIKEKLLSYDQQDEVVIFTDIFGGSVNNEVMKVVAKDNRLHVVTGINLLLIFEIILNNSNDSLDNIIEQSIKNAREGMINCRQCEESSSFELEDF